MKNIFWGVGGVFIGVGIIVLILLNEPSIFGFIIVGLCFLGVGLSVIRVISGVEEIMERRRFRIRGTRTLKQTLEDYDEAIRMSPQLATAYYTRGLISKEQGRKAEAIADFEKFISLTDSPQWIEMARQQIEELSK